MVPPTERLAFRAITDGDLDFLAEMVGDAEVMRHYPSVLDRAGAAAWIARTRGRYARDGGLGFFLAVERASGRPIGQIGILAQEVAGARELEVAYMVHRPYQRRGFAAEGAAAMRDHILGPLGARRAISLIVPANLASQAVARTIGMRPVGTTVHAGCESIVFAVEKTG